METASAATLASESTVVLVTPALMPLFRMALLPVKTVLAVQPATIPMDNVQLAMLDSS